MKPQKLRSLLEPYGTINRIFLSPEDPVEHSRRVRSGGNKKRLYLDGWVEFVRKKDAKKAVDLLNARTIGGKKGSFYRDDIWNLLYLKGFKWNNLIEQIAAENAERESRMRAEISRATRENKEFVRNVEKSKVLDGIKSKAATKRADADHSTRQVAETGPTEDDLAGEKGLRTFKQASKVETGDHPISTDTRRTLGRLF